MAKNTKPKVQPAPPLPVAAPLAPIAPNGQPDSPGTPGEPTPGVIDPEKNPASNQGDAATELKADPNIPTGPLPPSATTVPGVELEDDGKGKPETAQEAIDRVKEGEWATDEDRKTAMKRWPHLFAETAKD